MTFLLGIGLVVKVFVDDEARAALGFQIDFADIFADDADGEELQTSQCPNRAQRACPAADGDAYKEAYYGIYYHHKADQEDEQSEPCDNSDRLDAERGDALPRKRKHFLQRILAFARKTRGALIFDDFRLVADEGNHTSEKNVGFAV